ncbi:unnamed protein product [Anisakis simplex]|uniref:MAP kinase-activating death domain protein n=1 Tax=Anisakis simplex TaxID=6269 RepID=A0A0M3JXM9_ANISI|nr:unnamed protein product [Anisakis simplex]
MDEKGKELCPRLIDYLVIVGKRSRVRKSSQQSFDGGVSSSANIGATGSSVSVTNPELLRRYPTDDHKDFYLPTDVTVFCQPEGCITKGVPRRTQSLRDSHSFVFTLTEKDSAKIRYGVCLNFFECFETNRLSTYCKQSTNTSVQHSTITRRRDQKLSLTSLCLISHHPFLSTFRELLTLLKNLIDNCDYRIAHGALWSVLTGHWAETIPASVMHEIRELETWILMLLSAPVPVPGKTKVQLEVMPISIMPILEFALPDHTRFSLVDFPLHLPLELLGIDTAIKVLEAVMLECKVVLQSRNYNAVSMCVMAIVALLYPLEYMFPVIPLLPSYMPSAEQLLYAPTPFIIGIPSSFFVHKKITTLPNDVIVVDLDTNQVHMPHGMSLPELPEPDCTNLKNSFRASLGKMTMNTTDVNNIGGRHGSFESSYTIDSDVIDVAVRVAMIRFFNSANVFANFSEHTRTLRLYPRPVVALQIESFLRSRPHFTQFVLDLCKTQAVEYFAECSLCPRNETYVRVQTGTDNPEQIGDKIKWFSDALMPVHFTVYPNDSTLATIWHYTASNHMNSGSDSDEDNGSEGGNTDDAGSCSSIDDLVFESPDEIDPTLGNILRVLCIVEYTLMYECFIKGASKPLGEVNDVYREPLTLELPQSESALSIGSSSSGRSSPSSSVSTSAMDSEADFARLAENLALKSDSKGAFSFDHSDESTPIQNRKGMIAMKGFSSLQQPESITGTSNYKTPPLKVVGMKGIAHLTDSGEKVLGPQFMSALNGYAEKSHDMFSQMLNRTAPKAQALRDKTMRPIAAAAANRMEQSQHLVKTKTTTITNTNTAIQQSKNQQVVREICDQVLSGQGVGVFTYPKLKRLMEDESLRQLVCSKLNLGLETKHSEDDFVQDMHLNRSQYKGYVKVLQTCIVGLENSFNTPGSNGLASLFHVLEIAHTHFWAKESTAEAVTPASGLNTPSAAYLSSSPFAVHQQPSAAMSSSSSAAAQQQKRLPSTHIDTRIMSLSQANTSSVQIQSTSNDRPAEQTKKLSLAQQGGIISSQICCAAAAPFGQDADSVKSQDSSVASASVAAAHRQVCGIILPSGPPPPLPPRRPPPPRLPSLPTAAVACRSGFAGGAPSTISSLQQQESVNEGINQAIKIEDHEQVEGENYSKSHHLSSLNEVTTTNSEGTAMTSAEEQRSTASPSFSVAATNADNQMAVTTRTPPSQCAVALPSETATTTQQQSNDHNTTSSVQQQSTKGAVFDVDEKSETNTLVASQPSSGPSSPLPPRSLPVEQNVSSAMTATTDSPEMNRHYIYQDLILPSQNPLWQKMVFWENAFFDVVAQERDIVGMDQEPCEMIDRYSGLSECEKKRLELDEDRLLATLLHNLTAYMIMCGTGQKAIQQKIRRLLGKAHIGLVYSKTINQLLDQLPSTQSNGISLKPLGSRLMQKQSFTVHAGANAQGTLMFMEVCDDAVVLRAVTGAITDRWWYERLVNMTYSPKTKVLCLWRRHEDKVHMHKFYTKKCRELYACMKAAMERAAARGKVAVTGRDLGGEFPVHDSESNQGGLLQVRIDGVTLLFADRQACEIAWCLHRIFTVQFTLTTTNDEENASSSAAVAAVHNTGILKN